MPRLAIAACFAIAIVGFGIASSLGADFLPRIFEGSFAIDALRPPSVSLTQAIAEDAIKRVARMAVELVNDGPITILIDSHKQF